MGLLRSGRRRRAKIRSIQIEVVCLWIETHRLGSELSPDSLDDAELIWGVFIENMERPLSRCCEQLPVFSCLYVALEGELRHRLTGTTTSVHSDSANSAKKAGRAVPHSLRSELRSRPQHCGCFWSTKQPCRKSARR